MNQNPEENKKVTPATPPPTKQWNPYYRRNPDGTPGNRDRALRENAAKANAVPNHRNSPHPPAGGNSSRPAASPLSRPQQNRPQPPTKNAPAQGLGQPIRRAAPAARVKPAGKSEPLPPRHTAPPKDPGKTPTAPGGVRYRRNTNGTMSRVYPNPRTGTRNARRKRFIVIAVALLLVLGALIIGAVALVRARAKVKPDYTYNYNEQYTVKIKGDTAIPDDVGYLNMNYLAAIFSMTVSGSYEDMKFSTPDGEYISFIPTSRVTMVNGNRHIMEDAALLRGQEMWIPSPFVEEMFVGVEVTWDHEKHTVKITRKPTSAEDDTPAPLTFLLRPDQSANRPPVDTWADGYQYLTDMTAFRDAIEPENRDAYLILVNKQNSLPSTYVPADLVPVTNMKKGRENNRQRMCEIAELALQALYQDMAAAGFTDVGVTSGYRTYKLQELLHENYVIEEMNTRKISRAQADAIASTYSAYAGQSEHQTGLAVDMYNTASAVEAFADTPAFAWLKDHAHQYGFILRYPKEKVDITGYVFEPWHFRYVGRYHATQMYNQGLCLEEYLDRLN